MKRNDPLKDIQRVHLVGVGGIGVSALAPALLRRGIAVSGADPSRNDITHRLEAMGVRIDHEHRAENVEGASLVVATSAAKPNNPELQAAQAKGIPIWPRARMLGALLEPHRTVVITGAHGKTTVTAMIAHVFTELGLDPTAYIGGDVPGLGNVRLGEGEWAIAEGDESDGSFTWLKPDIAIVNNIDIDHLDFYPDLNAIIEQFQRFIDGVRQGGWVLLSADSEPCSRLRIPASIRKLTYGFSESADARGSDYVANGHGWGCEVSLCGESIGRLRLPQAGRCHSHNALAAIAAAYAAGAPVRDALEALGSYRGVHRRMELKGEVDGVRVIDDYAHHPNEIRAAIQGLRDRYRNRLIGVFQPHLYSRTLKLLDDFARCFAGLDLLVFTDIYPAREVPIPGVSGEILFRAARQNGVAAVYVPRVDEVAPFLDEIARSGDVIATMGAGDVWRAGETFLTLRSRGEEARQ